MKMAKRILSILMAVMMVLSCWVWVEPSAVASNTANAAEAAKDKYLFAYFTGNSSDGQTVHLAVSEDGLHYTALRNNEPVIIPSKGTGAVRDPYIWYNEQDNYYYIICTDMDSADNQWWDNCNGFLMWRSKDLIHWSDETFIDVYEMLQRFDEPVGIVHRAWAPQILWDGQSYVVYFSIDTDNVSYPADQLSIVYLKTTDLMDLDQYYEYGGIFYPGYDVNDADIIQHPTNGKWYLFYKPEATKEYPTTKINMMVSDNATGPYTSADSNNSRGLDIYSSVSEALEGGNGYFDNEGNLVMYADAYGHGSSYFYIAKTLANGDYMNWTVYGEDAHNINSLSPRHGSVVRITTEEYNRLLNNAYSITSSSFPATETLSDHLVGRYFTTDNAAYNAVTGNADLKTFGNLTTGYFGVNGVGYYTNFDGSSYAKIALNNLLPNGFNYNDGFTITFTALVYGDNNSRFYAISDGTNSTNFAVNGSESGAYVINNDYVQTTSTNLADSALHDFVISYANGNIVIYKDGELFLKKNRFNVDSKWEDISGDGIPDYVDQLQPVTSEVMDETWYDSISDGTLYIGALEDETGCLVGAISDFCIYDCSMSYYDVKAIQTEQDIESGLISGTPSAYSTFGSVVPSWAETSGGAVVSTNHYANLLYSPHFSGAVSGSGKDQNPTADTEAALTSQYDDVHMGIYYPDNTVLYVDGINNAKMPVMLAGRINTNQYDASFYASYPYGVNNELYLNSNWIGYGTNTDYPWIMNQSNYVGYTSANSPTCDLDSSGWGSNQNSRSVRFFGNVLYVNNSISFGTSGYKVYKPNWYINGNADGTYFSQPCASKHNIYVVNLKPLVDVRNAIATEYNSIVTNSDFCPATIAAYKAVVEAITNFNPQSYNYAGGTEAAVKACSADAQRLVDEYNTAKANLGGHKIVEIPAREATHELDGLTTGSYCEYCGKVTKEQTSYSIYSAKVPDSAHQIRKPTYKTPGLYWYSCSCGCGVSAQTAGYPQTSRYTYEANQIPYEITYENLFVFSEWANSNSSNPKNTDDGAVQFDGEKGTITIKSKTNDFYTAYGKDNGHYNLKAHVENNDGESVSWTVVPGNTYTLEYTITEDGAKEQVFVFFYDANGNGVPSPANRNNTFANVYGNGKAGTKYLTFSVPAGTEALAFRFGAYEVGTVTFSNIGIYEESRIQESGVFEWNPRIYRDTYFYGETLGALAETSRRGYTFKLWGFDANSNGIVDEDDAEYDFSLFVNEYQFVDGSLGVESAQNWRVFGIWEEGSYSIKFDANGGSGSMASLSTKYETEQTLTNKFTRTGYTFLGWSTDVNATTATYKDGAKVSRLGDVNETITLYAVWQINTYTIAFDNLVDFSKWNKTSASNATFATVTGNGFTLRSNDGAGEGTSTSPFFPVTPGKQYKVDIDITGDNWDVYLFFCDANGNWIDFDDSANRFSSNGSGNSSRIFTAPNKSEVVKAQIRVDANGSANSVTFDNIRVYETDRAITEGVSYEMPITVTYGQPYSNLPVPTKYGYEFIGWFDENGKLITEGTALTSETTTYLTSQWVVSSVVLDFDAPITIDPLDEVTGYAITSATLGVDYGNATLDGDKITYTPNKVPDRMDIITYSITYPVGGGKTADRDIDLYIVPASNMMFEEDRFIVTNETGNSWTTVGTATNAAQSVSDKNDVYGYDKAYDNTDTYSGGSALEVTVDSTTKRGQIMSFDFTGTGFDLYGQCASDSAVMVVTVKNNVTNAMVKAFVVDTYFKDSTYGTLNQVPILSMRDLEYGSYTIQVSAMYLASAQALQGATAQSVYGLRDVTAYYAPMSSAEMLYTALEEVGLEYIFEADDLEVVWFDEGSVFAGGMGASTYSLNDDTQEVVTRTVPTKLRSVVDAVRVYNPADCYGINDYYIAHELGAKYYNIMDNLKNGTLVTGDGTVTYVTYTPDKTDVDFATYEPKGSNEEFYLTNDSETALVFSVAQVAFGGRIMVSFRAASGNPVAKIGGSQQAITSATEMYYDITDYIASDGTVTIQNVGDGLLAIGNIKSTNTVAPIMMSTFNLRTARMMMAAPAEDVEFNAPEEEPEIIVPDEPETEEPSTEIPEVPSDDADEEEKSFIDKIYDLIDFIVYLIKKLFSTLDFMKTL